MVKRANIFWFNFVRSMLVLCLGFTLVIFNFAFAAQIELRNIKDPRIKDALFESYRDRHAVGIIRLQNDQKLRRLKKSQKIANLALGSMYLSYGYHQQAANIFDTFLGSSQPIETRNQIWFRLANIQYQSGLHQQALSSLSRIEKKLPAELREERKVMESIILIGQKRFKDAVKILLNLNRRSDWWLYGRYNLGVAYFQMGKVKEGEKILGKIGDRESENPGMQHLIDKANLVLAYVLLRNNKPARAEKYLKKMKVKGPHSNAALLGLGRAYAARQQHKKSLTPWLVLIERDHADPAVQDALVAIAAAFGQLKDYKKALYYYENALSIFQTEINRINSAANAVGEGKLFNELIRAQSIRNNDAVRAKNIIAQVLDSPEGNYLWPIIAGGEFQKLLFNYRQLDQSLTRLKKWAKEIESKPIIANKQLIPHKNRLLQLQQQVLLTSEKVYHHMRRLAYDELEKRKNRLLNYYNDAQFSTAQIYDYAEKRWGKK